mgnify:CR=1 FL=1
MNLQITKDDIAYNNTFFWHGYFHWFRGHDDEKEINIDEVLEVIPVNEIEFKKWAEEFFPEDEKDENPRYIGGKLNDIMSFTIEFQNYETCYFLNDTYIGNLGGHFEAWFLTWDELLAFEKYDFLFMLLLPMTAIEKSQIEVAKRHIVKYLNQIPLYEGHSEYIAQCIINGLEMDDNFYELTDIGIACNANHSVRNIIKYPRYKEDVATLNKSLEMFVNS